LLMFGGLDMQQVIFIAVVTYVTLS
jgi:hypothetical protein